MKKGGTLKVNYRMKHANPTTAGTDKGIGMSAWGRTVKGGRFKHACPNDGACLETETMDEDLCVGEVCQGQQACIFWGDGSSLRAIMDKDGSPTSKKSACPETGQMDEACCVGNIHREQQACIIAFLGGIKPVSNNGWR